MAKWIIAFAFLYFGTRVFAEDAKPAVSAKSATADSKADSDKLDLKQLEDKYWAAKDNDFSVVQNRTYTKANRWFLSGSYGTLINDPYSTARMNNFAAGYYFSERWGIELAHESGNLVDGPSVNQLKSSNGVTPNYNKFLDYTSINFMWVPMYAKMSVLEKSIWYFDLQFAAGIGMMDYQNQITSAYSEGGPVNKTAVGLNLDVTANVFFSKNWAFRVDMKNKFTSESLERYQLTGSGSSSRDMGAYTQQDTTFLIGFTYFH